MSAANVSAAVEAAVATAVEFCEPCERRGKKGRVATHLVDKEWFCDSCFNGKGTPAEMGGGQDRKGLARQRFHYQQNREERLAAMRNYAAEHKEEIAARVRTWYQANRVEINQRRVLRNRKKREAAQ